MSEQAKPERHSYPVPQQQLESVAKRIRVAGFSLGNQVRNNNGITTAYRSIRGSLNSELSATIRELATSAYPTIDRTVQLSEKGWGMEAGLVMGIGLANNTQGIKSPTFNNRLLADLTALQPIAKEHAAHMDFDRVLSRAPHQLVTEVMADLPENVFDPFFLPTGSESVRDNNKLYARAFSFVCGELIEDALYASIRRAQPNDHAAARSFYEDLAELAERQVLYPSAIV